MKKIQIDKSLKIRKIIYHNGKYYTLSRNVNNLIKIHAIIEDEAKLIHRKSSSPYHDDIYLSIKNELIFSTYVNHRNTYFAIDGDKITRIKADNKIIAKKKSGLSYTASYIFHSAAISENYIIWPYLMNRVNAQVMLLLGIDYPCGNLRINEYGTVVIYNRKTKEAKAIKLKTKHQIVPAIDDNEQTFAVSEGNKIVIFDLY